MKTISLICENCGADVGVIQVNIPLFVIDNTPEVLRGDDLSISISTVYDFKLNYRPD